MTRLISFAVLIVIIILIGLLFYKVLIGFFIPVFLSAVLVVVFRPLHRWVLEKAGQREQVAAVATTLLIMLTLLLPIGVVATASAVQGLRLIEQNDAKTIALRISQLRSELGLEMPAYNEWLRIVGVELDEIVERTADSVVSEENVRLRQVGQRTVASLKELKQAVEAIEPNAVLYKQQLDELIELADQVGAASDEEFRATNLAVDLKSKFSTLRSTLLGGSLMAFVRDRANPTKETIDKLVQEGVAYAQPRLLSFTGATGTFVIKLLFGSVILVVSTYFFLVDGPSMIKSIMHLSPLDDSYEQELLLEFDRISRAVVLATILSALAQGLTAGIGFYFAGMEYLTLLIMLTTAFAMVPFVGPAVVWVPVCIYLAVNDHLWAAGLLAAWGVLVVGTIDNVVKAIVLHGQSQLHPLLALLSVLGGVQALGPIGIVVGPMVVAMLQTLLSILQRELLHIEEQKYVLSSSGPAPAASVPMPSELATLPNAQSDKSAEPPGDPTTVPSQPKS
jgi:predicted PurR-regulated permease PerM